MNDFFGAGFLQVQGDGPLTASQVGQLARYAGGPYKGRQQFDQIGPGAGYDAKHIRPHIRQKQRCKRTR